jgi:Niemann-Pick C1 protein
MGITSVHKKNYCAIYSTGGKTSFFGPDLPRANNVPAQKLSPKDHIDLVDICGDSWRNTDYACCDGTQIASLKENLNKASPLISSCPACKENFYQLFCHFSCSPNQSQFMDVLSTIPAMNGNEVVSELDFYVAPEFASPLYDSCKNIKFSATNGYAMDLIGGGAKNYTEFLKFLGDKKPQLGGSPFQINFKLNLDDFDENNNLTTFQLDTKSCNDSDPNFACACSDCPQVCPLLPDMPNSHAGFSTTFILILYFAHLFMFFTIMTYVRYRRSRKGKKDASPFSDDNANIEATILENEVSTDIADMSYSSHTHTNLMSLQSKKTYIVNNYLEKMFYRLGYSCSSYPRFVLTTSASIVALLSCFIYFIQFETNPVNLWVSPSADAYMEKQVFDESFGPFYRTQQIIISNSSGGPILNDYSFVEWWFAKEAEIQTLSTEVIIDGNAYNVQYDDICFKPLEETCILESFTQYFDGDINNLPETSDWKSKISRCANSPVECLPSFQQPLKKNLLFGHNSEGAEGDVLKSSAIVVTLLNNNDNDPHSAQVAKAEKWENELESYLLTNLTQEAHERGLDISFMAEVSLEKELNKSTNTDVKIVVISYLVMFVYASYALLLNSTSHMTNISFINSSFITPFGKVSGDNIFLRCLTKTRFTLGLVGIGIVLVSVFSAMGFWSLLGLKSTLIIAEVIPFLILAVGVDNIFLISNELRNINELSVTTSLDLNDRIAKTMANIGPSILLSSLCQFICFSLGGFVGMPAVKNFSLYTSAAIVLNTLLQITAFVSFLTLEEQRIMDGGLDLLPFIKVEKSAVSLPIDPHESLLSPNLTEQDVSNSLNQMLNESSKNGDGLIKNFFKNYYGPLLFKQEVQGTIIFLVLALFGISLSLLSNVQLGLDQRLAIPSDSFLIDYFDDMYQYIDVGPPIYFVLDGLDVTNQTYQKEICSKFTTCDSFSLVNIIGQEYKRSNDSTIAEPASSWMDDFLLWLNPDLSDCCLVKRRPDKPGKDFCPPFSSPRLCESCYEGKPWDYQMHGFPEGDEFMEYFNEWIDAPSYPCPLGGKAPYTSSIYRGNETGRIQRSAFRSSHTPLRSQDDFISAYHNSLRVVAEIKKYHPDMNLFAYSPFYIFFVQYETIVALTVTLLAAGMILVGVISMVILGSVRNSLVLVANLVLIIVNIMGWMAITGISLNAVSLVNLLICLGLSVEFSIHLFKHFNFNEEEGEASRDDSKTNRAYGSLVYIGSTTLGGITLTKLIGIGVLSFTKSQIFRVYYFKMWAGLIIIASVHALVVAPILLGRFGSPTVYGRSTYSRVVDDSGLRRRRNSVY